MKEKKYRKIVKKLGGTINQACVVDFPDTLRINTKKEALDLLDILLFEGEQISRFTVNQDAPIKALKKAIRAGAIWN